ncbi:MAG: hypothetical protein AB7K36_01295 [Chloroflexota bacterium]
MNVPKLSPLQWFRLVTVLLPLLRGLVRVAGTSIVAVIRALIDIVAQVETLFPADPADIDPSTGKPRKRGSEKAQAFADLVLAAFTTADESVGAVQARIGDIGAIGTAIVDMFNEWKILKEVPNA